MEEVGGIVWQGNTGWICIFIFLLAIGPELTREHFILFLWRQQHKHLGAIMPRSHLPLLRQCNKIVRFWVRIELVRPQHNSQPSKGLQSVLPSRRMGRQFKSEMHHKMLKSNLWSQLHFLMELMGQCLHSLWSLLNRMSFRIIRKRWGQPLRVQLRKQQPISTMGWPLIKNLQNNAFWLSWWLLCWQCYKYVRSSPELLDSGWNSIRSRQ